ncbi:MAG: TetR/AcrR family transcriptional regulator, partial [Gammaproteobacteria bacterium]|nr:TetR/AcrR family transcriptional regulator [Gammaproteobacteria bacterium]
MANKTNTKPRDSTATRSLLIQSVGELMAQKGIAALGVNAVAKQAGVDKVLIYRYFDGLPGLIEAYAREGDFWPTLEEFCGGDMEEFLQLPYTERAVQAAKNFLRAIRKRPLTQEILAWEMIESNELTRELDSVRESRSMQLMPLLAD